MRVIILGGSGFIGRALTQALISRGDEVVVPTRHVPAATPSTGPEYQLWDGQDHSSLSQLLNGADAPSLICLVKTSRRNVGALHKKNASQLKAPRGAGARHRSANANRKTQSLDTGFGNRLLRILARKRFGSRLYRRQSRRFRFFGDHHHPMGTFNTAGGTFGTPPVHHPDSARVGIGWRYACQAAPGVSAWAWRAGGDRKAAVRLDSS